MDSGVWATTGSWVVIAWGLAGIDVGVAGGEVGSLGTVGDSVGAMGGASVGCANSVSSRLVWAEYVTFTRAPSVTWL